MLIHQLLKETDFQEKCTYCGKDFQLKSPEFSRYGDKEYVTLSCEKGHKHTIKVDMDRRFDAMLIHRDIDANKKIDVKPLEKVVIEH
ncbi:MAG: hypothetical protein WC254_04495 [Candidatus Woesearchaeota archaeon]|jgi:hypothetical protein